MVMALVWTTVAVLLVCGPGRTMSADFEVPTNTSDTFDDANRTSSWTDANETDVTRLKTAVVNDPILEFRSWWCPPGYQLMINLQVCRQRSCLTMLNSNDNETHTDNVELCRALEPSYVQCHKILLAASQYAVAADGSGLQVPITTDNNETTVLIPLGEFVLLRNGTASVCLTNEMSVIERRPDAWYTEDEANVLPEACMPFAMPSDELKINRSDGTALVFNGTKSFLPNFYDEDHRGPSLFNGSINVCYELSTRILTCHRGIGFRDEFELLPNMDAREVFVNGIVHPLGTYMVTLDAVNVVFCFEHYSEEEVVRREEKRILYGIVTAVSAVFLFVALLAHTFFPSLNYHAMALLCHIISMLVMYVTLSINYLNPPTGWPAPFCYTLFAIGYVATLGAFFWLSVLAFDLWRVFAKMRGTFSPANDKRKRIRFFVQCAYSWGIPAVMCALLLIIDNSPDLEESLGLEENIPFMCWFTNDWAHFIFFYLPIIAILVSNVVFFTLTVVNLRNAGKGTDVLNKKVNRQLFRVFIKLFIVMGITWFAEIISWLFPTNVRYYYVTDTINALQGVSIFLVYVCKRSTLELIQRRTGWCGGANKRNSQATQSSSTSQVSNKTGDRKVSADQSAAAGAARRPAQSPGTFEMDVVRGTIPEPMRQQHDMSNGTYSHTPDVY